MRRPASERDAGPFSRECAAARRREPDPDERRAKRLVLTEKGLNVVTNLRHTSHPVATPTRMTTPSTNR
jgi:hypothetical protein